MLEVGGGFFEGVVVHLQDVLEAAQVALIHAGDLLGQVFLILDLLQLKEPAFGLSSIPHYHTHFIGGAEGGQHTLGALAGHFIAIGELHAVHDQHHRAAGQHLFAVQLHAHRQGGFQRRAPIAARGIGLVSAHTNQAHAKIAHGALQQFLAVGAQVPRGDVADENGVVTLHLGEGAGEGIEADEADFQMRSLQGGRQLFVFLRLRRHD